MAEARDHVIQSRVRAVLQRRWIDGRGLSYGSVNGVVYVRGVLRQEAVLPSTAADASPTGLELLRSLECDLRAIDGVKDVVLQIEGYARKGDQWERTTGSAASR